MPSVKNANNNGLNGLNPLSYMGVNPLTPPEMLIKKGVPTAKDMGGIQIGTLWLDVSSSYETPPTPPTSNDIYMLVSKANNGTGPVATWVQLGSVIGIDGDSGGVQIGPVVTLSGGITGLIFVGLANTETLEFHGINANDGVANINTDSNGNGVNIGLGNVARVINIGNSAAAHIVGLGSTTGAATTTIEGGTGGIEIHGTGVPSAFPGVTISADNSDIVLNAGTGDTRIATDAANSNILIGTGSNAKQITIGNTTATSSLALNADVGNITAMGISGVVVANPNVVTIDTVTGQMGSQAVSTGGLTWNLITAASANMLVNNGYVANNAGTVVLTLPAVSAFGDLITVTGMNNATGWRIAQNAGQSIRFGPVTTTIGVGGSLASTATGDSVQMVCVVANTQWNVFGSLGNITIV